MTLSSMKRKLRQNKRGGKEDGRVMRLLRTSSDQRHHMLVALGVLDIWLIGADGDRRSRYTTEKGM